MFCTEEEARCKKCKRIATKLVPLKDNDQNHTGKLMCKSCKKFYIYSLIP